MCASDKILIIAGPTAGGKSAVALKAAQQFNGVIINADSLQVYKDLQILSARPSAQEMEGIDHRLYGVLEGDQPASVGWYVEQATQAIHAIQAEKKLPILVGGTGMYLRALMQGLAAIPVIDEKFRAQSECLFANEDEDVFRRRLRELDPITESKIKPRDRQRLIRAMEVVLGTGKPLSYWVEQQGEHGFKNTQFISIVVQPPREVLYERCNKRFELMLEQGAEKEVEVLLSKGYGSKLTVMKAIGVPELKACFEGSLTRQEAITVAQQKTRNYAKRQMTWFRNQLRPDVTLGALDQVDECLKKIQKYLER